KVVMDQLLAAGWVQIKANPFHKKSQLFELSDEGKKAYKNMQHSELKQMKRLDLDISEKRLDEALKTIIDLNIKIDDFLRKED
ncbi:MAG: hypothetical protein KDD37_07905, partial [Bdellovibrionales bacterium]|nr:hypothetical protein [Bdellovibrionales bacterium]